MKYILLFVISINIIQTQECQFKWNNYKYDFSSLQQKDYWEVKSDEQDSGFFSLAYVFNFCGKDTTQCEGIPGAYQAIDVMGALTQACDLLGQSSKQTVQVLDQQKGIQIKYPMGESCETSENLADIGQPKSITFDIFCGSSAGDWKIMPSNSQDITNCNAKLQITHPAGCYKGQLSGVFSLMKSIIYFSLVAFILYIIIGTIYNYRHKGIKSTDAIPHYKQLKQVPQQSVKYTKITITYIKQQSNIVIQKFKKNNNQYRNPNEENYDQL